jgi:beta-glucosidase
MDEMTDNVYPDDFLWGVASAGHQIEGNNFDSDTWFLENMSPTIFREPSGRAADGWNRWEEDLDLVAGLGLNSYRFSVEWARIEPTEGAFSEAALDHYEAVIDGCIVRGLAPVVTFSHFTSPHWFAKRGAWLDPESANLFARYCGTVMDRFGDRIAIAVTFNEPDLPEMLSWLDLPPFVAELERATLEAASVKASVARYRAGNVMLREDFAAMKVGLTEAHRAAKTAIKQRRPELKVGLSLAIIDDVAAPGGEQIRDRKRAEVYQHWLELASEDDFVGVQN